MRKEVKRKLLYEYIITRNFKIEYYYKIYLTPDSNLSHLFLYDVYLNNHRLDRFDNYIDAKQYISYHKKQSLGGWYYGK